MNSYRKGRKYEYKVIKELKERGALKAWRGAGSHGFDVTAIFPDVVLFVSVKYGKISKVETDELRKLATAIQNQDNVVVEVWIYDKERTGPTKSIFTKKYVNI